VGLTMKPVAHPTRWTLVLEDGLCLYESQFDAEAELRRAQARGERAYILPPTAAWGGKAAVLNAPRPGSRKVDHRPAAAQRGRGALPRCMTCEPYRTGPPDDGAVTRRHQLRPLGSIAIRVAVLLVSDPIAGRVTVAAGDPFGARIVEAFGPSRDDDRDRRQHAAQRGAVKSREDRAAASLVVFARQLLGPF
jgi:hypothetical protein